MKSYLNSQKGSGWTVLVDDKNDDKVDDKNDDKVDN